MTTAPGQETEALSRLPRAQAQDGTPRQEAAGTNPFTKLERQGWKGAVVKIGSVLALKQELLASAAALTTEGTPVAPTFKVFVHKQAAAEQALASVALGVAPRSLSRFLLAVRLQTNS